MNNLTCLHLERESLSGRCFLPDYTLPNRLPLQTAKGKIYKFWLYVQDTCLLLSYADIKVLVLPDYLFCLSGCIHHENLPPKY